MNQTLIDKWNDEVRADDVVVFLGDLGRFADEKSLRRWLDELHGRVIFIKGNHDTPSRYVDGVNTHQYYILKRGDREFCCTHRPENAPRFWDGWTIHGNYHNGHPVEYPLVNQAEQRVNVSVELTGYQPVPENKLIALIEEGERVSRLHA